MASTKNKNSTKQPKPKAPRNKRVAAPIDEAVEKFEQPFQLPRGCNLEYVEKDIRRYMCFEFENCVYILRPHEHKQAKQASNFTCTIHMHVKGETPTRLISVINEDKEEAVMHVGHDMFNTLGAFRKAVTGEGNYKWMGTEGDYMHYLWYMMDRMGSGRMILEPGMQPEGFFAYTNMVANGSVIELDRFGCFNAGRTRYYIPAANRTDPNSEVGYGNARKVVYVESDVTFEALSRQLLLVHKEHSMLGLVHAIATVFQDQIRGKLQAFPIPFYYGPPGTGKDQIVKSGQTLFGIPQPALRLPACNTGVATVNLFAELRSIPLYLTEWASNLKPDLHTFVMGIWDGEGRRRGERVQAGRSRFSTEDVPIRCTASVSGNEYPNILDQLLDRLVVTEMPKLSGITMEMRENYRDLAKMNEKGYSYLLAELVKHREEFIRSWYQDSYALAQNMVNVALGDRFISERMRTNISILLSVRLFFQGRLKWAFSADQFCDWLVTIMLRQQARRLSGDEVSNWWTCFIAGVNAGELVKDKHFKLDTELNVIGFYWNDVFPVYMKHHRNVFGTPGKRDIQSKLVQHQCFIPCKSGGLAHKAYRIGERKSTAYLFDAMETGTDLIGLLSNEPVKSETDEVAF